MRFQPLSIRATRLRAWAMIGELGDLDSSGSGASKTPQKSFALKKALTDCAEALRELAPLG
jgi:hypothetical protein